MFHNSLVKNQRGFLMPLAIFIVVVMGLFALVIARTNIQTSTSGTLEVISTQAFYAAESGAQRGMQQLFLFTPPAGISRQQVDRRCVDLNATYSDAVPGLRGCSTVVTCRCMFGDNTTCAPITPANYTSTGPLDKVVSSYRIISEATCGVGNFQAQRSIEVGSFLRQE